MALAVLYQSSELIPDITAIKVPRATAPIGPVKKAPKATAPFADKKSNSLGAISSSIVLSGLPLWSKNKLTPASIIEAILLILLPASLRATSPYSFANSFAVSAVIVAVKAT
jgi:hypothetical protein